MREETWPVFAPQITLPGGWEEWIWVEVGVWGEGRLRGGVGPRGATGMASPGPVFGVSSSWLTLVTPRGPRGGKQHGDVKSAGVRVSLILFCPLAPLPAFPAFSFLSLRYSPHSLTLASNKLCFPSLPQSSRLQSTFISTGPGPRDREG